MDVFIFFFRLWIFFYKNGADYFFNQAFVKAYYKKGYRNKLLSL